MNKYNDIRLNLSHHKKVVHDSTIYIYGPYTQEWPTFLKFLIIINLFNNNTIISCFSFIYFFINFNILYLFYNVIFYYCPRDGTGMPGDKFEKLPFLISN